MGLLVGLLIMEFIIAILVGYLAIKEEQTTFEAILTVISNMLILYGIINNLLVMVWAILTLVFAFSCRKIGKSKGISYGFLLGWFLGIIGLIIICVSSNEQNNKNENNNKYQDLERIQKLKDSGTITQAEFEIEKAKLLR